MQELWKPIEGDESYSISTYGRVLSYKRNPNGELKSPFISKGTYLVVTLSGNKKHKIHRLVAKAFIPNPYNLPDVNHIDGNGFNNLIYNLEWCTHGYNNRYRFKLGTMCNKGENNPQSKITNQQALEIYNLAHNTNLTSREIADMFNISTTIVNNVKTGRRFNSITRHKPINIFRPIINLNQREK